MKNKFLKFGKKIATFFAIVTLSFSNMPFDVLTGVIDGYVKTSNIVDQAWQLSQNDNVVDNFVSSYRNKNTALLERLAGNLKINEAHAATAFVAASQVNVSAASAVVNKPTGTVDGDIMFSLVIHRANEAPTTVPAGWTLLGNNVNATTHYSSLYWKIAATEGASYTWGWPTAQRSAVTVATYRGGFNPASPINVFSNTAYITSDTNVRAASMNVTATNPPILFFGWYYLSTLVSFTPPTTPAAMTENVDWHSTVSRYGREVASLNWTGTGATGVMNAISSAAGTPKHAFAVALNPPVVNTTTISNFVTAESGNSTIAPNASGLVDSFGFATNSGTDTVTAATVGLAVGMGQYIQTVAITNNGDTVTYCSAAPTGDTASLSGCTVPVTTTNTQFKIKLTAKPHASMPAPAGGSYAVTATVTGWTGTNATHAGTDSGSSTLTIDNASPNGATLVSGTAGTNANTINWTTSNSADFNTTSGSVILRWAAASAGAEVPVEGSTYTSGNAIGTATVACVISSAASTPLSEIDGTGGSAGCTTVALTNGQAYTYKAFQQDINGNYDVGVTIGTFTPAVAIAVTSYSNTTEPTLDYAALCTGCGARIGGGVGFRQSITIAGSGFGADPGAANRSTASNNIKIGTHQIVTTNVTAWSATSITFLTDSDVAGDTDADWGTVFGGASALVVTAGGAPAAGLNFYVFPQITTVTQPVGFSADTAREYDALDTDGVITLNGTRFGSSQGTGSVTTVAQSAPVNSWTNTAIEVQVPPTIVDTTNTGSISMTQGTGGSSKTSTYLNTLRILPRITGFTPASGSEGSAVTVNGNHFCQGAGCPAGAFSTGVDDVVFTSAKPAVTFTSWSAVAMATAVPVGAVTGNVVLRSSSFSSNGKSFTVLSNTPAPPTSLNQWKNSGLTQSIAIGGVASITPVYLTMIMEVPGISGGTLYPQIEYKARLTDFVCTGTTACASAIEGVGVAGPGPVDCGSTGNGCSIAVSPADNDYHWQARVCHNIGGTHTASCGGAGDYPSAWASFGGNGELITDFKIDTTGPVITFTGADTCATAQTNLGTNGVTISWTTNELASGQVEYSTDANLGGSTISPVPALSANTSQSLPLTNLNSGTLYYFRVKAQDIAGNLASRPSVNPYCSFTTSSNLFPAKTTKSFINGEVGVVSAATPYYFTVNVPETSPLIQSAYIEVFGIVSGGSGTIAVQANGAASRNYTVSAASPALYRFFYQIPSPGTETNLNLNDVTPCTNDDTPGILPETPPCNKLTITPSTVSMYVLSAKIITTYTYTP